MMFVMQEHDGYNPDVKPGDSPMGHSQASKAESRERILAEASRQIRREGLESVSVGTLMKSVGLTHGGFYGHFESRAVLLQEALQRALLEGEANVEAAGPAKDFASLVRGYLSRTHRDARDSGCAVAALVSDAARAEDGARAIMTRHVDSFIASVADTLDGDEARAIAAVSAMVGALALSRAVADPARSDTILKVVRDYLGPSNGTPPPQVSGALK
jgi:TetR/AcrR family transcriptional repressor of nem operon